MDTTILGWKDGDRETDGEVDTQKVTCCFLPLVGLLYPTESWQTDPALSPVWQKTHQTTVEPDYTVEMQH